MVCALLSQALKTKTMDLTKQKTHSNEDILRDFKQMYEEIENLVEQQVTKLEAASN